MALYMVFVKYFTPMGPAPFFWIMAYVEKLRHFTRVFRSGPFGLGANRELRYNEAS